MIQASELRIGNWVLINGKPIRMDAKTFHAIIHGFDGYIPEPIPLTPEILEKCGFENKAVHEYWISKRANNLWASIAYDMTGHVLLQDTTYDGLVRITNIKFLHQLQNLYFALTGEELEINL